MIKILFLRSEKAFLPEIDAYVKFFNMDSEFFAVDASSINNDFSYKEFDVIWEIKGFGGVRSNNNILIHDYASLSLGFSAKLKNQLKRMLNPRPDIRIFLNDDVRKGFNFKDNVDYAFRDMGIDKDFVYKRNEKKEYEFVYTGSINKTRGIDRFLKVFNEKPNGKICLIGDVEDDIYKKFKNNKDIIFTGKVDYSEVPEIASKAIYGLNFIPNMYPYNLQTSTKLIEYLALGLKIITTDYKWVIDFEKKHGCNFYKINDKDITFNSNDICNFDFKSDINYEDFLWDNIIGNSGIKESIYSRYYS